MAAINKVTICNIGLQLIGGHRIVSIDDNTVSGRACKANYDVERRAELEAHPWNFAIKRDSIAADSPAPSWGRQNSFTLPSDFLSILAPYPEFNFNSLDWQIENGAIYTNDSAPLQIRYIFDCDDPSAFSSLFARALGARIGMAICEELTQSNSKVQTAQTVYRAAISEARRLNAIQNVPVQTPDDTFLTVRQ